jgi:hypothetical protein
MLLSFALRVHFYLSCDKKRVFDEYKSVGSKSWHKDSIVSFDLPKIDTSKAI